MREHRKHYGDLSPDEKRRAICRAHTNQLIRRGQITRLPCEVCGQKAQAHHPDYTKPREIRWLCRKHHNQVHKENTSIGTGNERANYPRQKLS